MAGSGLTLVHPVIRLNLRASPRQCRTWPTTTWGVSSREQNRAILWKHFRSTTSASSASGLAVRSRPQPTSSAAG